MSPRNVFPILNIINKISDPDTCTARALVGAQVQVLPDPDVQLNDPGTDWLTVWRRWQSGVLSKISRNILFFFLHDKTMTRGVRGGQSGAQGSGRLYG